MANKPTPYNLRLLKGTHRPARHGPKPDKPLAVSKTTPKAPAPPTWLPAAAKAEYRRVVKVLGSMGVLELTDRAILSSYSLYWAKLQAAPESFKAADMTAFRLLMVELGFTPCSRSKLTVMQQEDEREDNPWDEL